MGKRTAKVIPSSETKKGSKTSSPVESEEQIRILFPPSKPDPKRARYEIGPVDDVKTVRRKDGKVRIEIPAAEVFRNIVLPPDRSNPRPRLKRQTHEVTVVFSSPYLARYLSKNRKAYGDFLRALRAGLDDSYEIVEQDGRGRGRPIDPDQEVRWEAARRQYPHLLDRFTKEPDLAQRVQAKLNLSHVSRASVPNQEGRDDQGRPSTNRRPWTASPHQLALAVLGLRGCDAKALRTHGIRHNAPRDPDVTPYIDEVLDRVINPESTGTYRD